MARDRARCSPNGLVQRSLPALHPVRKVGLRQTRLVVSRTKSQTLRHIAIPLGAERQRTPKQGPTPTLERWGYAAECLRCSPGELRHNQAMNQTQGFSSFTPRDHREGGGGSWERIPAPTSRISNSGDLGWGLKIDVSRELPRDTEASGPESALEGTKHLVRTPKVCC